MPQSNPPMREENAGPSVRPSVSQLARRTGVETQGAIEIGKAPSRGLVARARRRPLAVALAAGALIGGSLAFGIAYSRSQSEADTRAAALPSASAPSPLQAPAAEPSSAPAISVSSIPTASAKEQLSRPSTARGAPRPATPTTPRKSLTPRRNHDFGF